MALQTSQLVYNILDANMEANGTWESNTKKCLQILEGAIQEYLSSYRVAGGVLFTEFSEYLPTILDVSKMSKDTSMSKLERRAQRLDEIVQAVTLDFASVFEQKVYRSEIAQGIEDYPTEKKQGYFSINVGYGGIYLGNDYAPASYAASPYLGLSFPLAQRSSRANWLQNTAVLVGFFWQDLPSSEQQSMSGFLIEKPVLVGLDYKLFQFIRLNAGVTILEETNALTTVDLDRSLRIQPFVGLSAKVDISLGLGK
ncbi:MAG: hypothetical protein AAGH79_08570 [Bacteroidota bacterium]